MEIVLQWLDDLDDFLFAGLLAWERVRRGLLQVGLASALAEAAAASSDPYGIPLLGGLAAGSVTIALLGTALASLADARRRSGSPRGRTSPA